MWWLNLLVTWGCVPELTKDCMDMTNASSTYLGIVIGAAIGGVVSWWIYNRQKKTSDKQDFILSRIKELDENHDAILKKLEDFDNRHETALERIFDLSQKIDFIIKKQESANESVEHGSPEKQDSK